MHIFISIGLLVYDCGITIGKSNKTENMTDSDLLVLKFYLNVNCCVGNRAFLTLWTIAIRSSMDASFEQ